MNDATDSHGTVCDFCLGPSGVEFELYCCECDRAACTFCMVRVTSGGRAFYCPECADEAASPAASASEGNA